mgnify:CR=1 FL=1
MQEDEPRIGRIEPEAEAHPEALLLPGHDTAALGEQEPHLAGEQGPEERLADLPGAGSARSSLVDGERRFAIEIPQLGSLPSLEDDIAEERRSG